MAPSQVQDKEASESNSLLSAYLYDRDEACPRCGYNLRMLTGERCPECGDRLRLRVGLVEARLGAYITALVGCCLGFGGAVFFLIIILCYAPIDYWQDSLAPWLLIGQALITGTLMSLLLARRLWFTKKPRGKQVALTVFAWLVTLSMSALALFYFED